VQGIINYSLWVVGHQLCEVYTCFHESWLIGSEVERDVRYVYVYIYAEHMRPHYLNWIKVGSIDRPKL
jgi:hypothetical protein